MFSRPRIIPVLLIDNEDMVKTINFKKPRYLGDPINAVKIFNLKDVDELCILDISSSKNGTEPNYSLLADIANQAFMPLGYGGGIKSLDEAKKILALGYEKIVINTSFIINPNLVTELAKEIGSQSVVVSIDVKKNKNDYCVYIYDGTKKIEKDPIELAKYAEELGAGEIIINSIDNDGTMNGFDTHLISAITSAVSIPVIACGGAGNVSDLKEALDNGAHAAAAGSMFVYYGRLKAVLITFPTNKDFVDAGVYKI